MDNEDYFFSFLKSHDGNVYVWIMNVIHKPWTLHYYKYIIIIRKSSHFNSFSCGIIVFDVIQ